MTLEPNPVIKRRKKGKKTTNKQGREGGSKDEILWNVRQGRRRGKKCNALKKGRGGGNLRSRGKKERAGTGDIQANALHAQTGKNPSFCKKNWGGKGATKIGNKEFYRPRPSGSTGKTMVWPLIKRGGRMETKQTQARKIKKKKKDETSPKQTPGRD